MSIFCKKACLKRLLVFFLFSFCCSCQLKSMSWITSQPRDILQAIDWDDEKGCSNFLKDSEQANIKIKGVLPLFYAVQKGRKELSQFLIEHGARVDSKDDKGNTVLHAFNGSSYKEKGRMLFSLRESSALEMCQMLLDSSAQPDVKNDYGETPLHISCQEGRLDCCKVLIEKGANIHAETSEGATCFHEAVWSNNNVLCSFLKNRGVDIHKCDNRGRNAYYHLYDRFCHDLGSYCVQPGPFDVEYHPTGTILRLLDSFEIDAFATGYDGTSLFHSIAQRLEGWDFFLWLLDYAKKKVKFQDNKGNSPLHIACTHKCVPHIYTYFLHNVRNKSFFCTWLIDALISAGADVNAINNAGLTPLHIACMKGNYSMCRLLKSYGADIMARDNRSVTPLMLCAQYGHSNILKMLCAKSFLSSITNKKSPPCEIKDDEIEGTALHWAVSYGNVDCCKILINSDFNPNELADNLSLLHVACQSNAKKMVEYVLTVQKNIAATDLARNNALHFACYHGYFNAVRVLILDDASKQQLINAKNERDETPLHCAVVSGQEKIVKEMLKYDALPNEKNAHGMTPLMCAALHRRCALCKLLIAKLTNEDFLAARKVLKDQIIGNSELEDIFKLHYDSVPLLRLSSSQNSTQEEVVPDSDVNNSVSSTLSLPDDLVYE